MDTWIMEFTAHKMEQYI